MSQRLSFFSYHPVDDIITPKMLLPSGDDLDSQVESNPPKAAAPMPTAAPSSVLMDIPGPHQLIPPQDDIEIIKCPTKSQFEAHDHFVHDILKKNQSEFPKYFAIVEEKQEQEPTSILDAQRQVPTVASEQPRESVVSQPSSIPSPRLHPQVAMIDKFHYSDDEKLPISPQHALLINWMRRTKHPGKLRQFHGDNAALLALKEELNELIKYKELFEPNQTYSLKKLQSHLDQRDESLIDSLQLIRKRYFPSKKDKELQALIASETNISSENIFRPPVLEHEKLGLTLDEFNLCNAVFNEVAPPDLFKKHIEKEIKHYIATRIKQETSTEFKGIRRQTFEERVRETKEHFSTVPKFLIVNFNSEFKRGEQSNEPSSPRPPRVNLYLTDVNFFQRNDQDNDPNAVSDNIESKIPLATPLRQ